MIMEDPKFESCFGIVSNNPVLVTPENPRLIDSLKCEGT